MLNESALSRLQRASFNCINIQMSVIWKVLHRMAEGHPDALPAEESRASKIRKTERRAVLKEIKKMLPSLVDQVLEDMHPPDDHEDL